MRDKRDECGCHRGCTTDPHDCERPCRWPDCLTDAEHTALVEEIVIDDLTERYHAEMRRREPEFLGDLNNWRPTGLRLDPPPPPTEEEPVSRWNMTTADGKQVEQHDGTRAEAVARANTLSEPGQRVYTEKDGTTVHLSDGTSR